MTELIGLLMLGSWAWGLVILFRRTVVENTGEKLVLAIAGFTLILFVIGSLME